MEFMKSHLITFAALCAFSLPLIAAEKIFPGEKGDIILEPINHATFSLTWNGKTIFVDPVGGAQKFKGKPDLILVTDIHGDHLNKETLTGVASEITKIIAPEAVASQLEGDLK